MNKLFFAALLALAIFPGCRKKEKEYSLFSARDAAFADAIFADVAKVVEEVAADTDGIRNRMNCIDDIIVDTLSTPRSILIDFGSDICEDSFGVVRRGKIFVTFTGRLYETGTIITTTFDEYTVDGYAVEGSHAVTNIGINENDNPVFTINVTDASLTAPDGSFTISWDSQRQREWVEGSSTFWLVDDEYSITGQAEGVNRYGDPFEMVISEPLRVSFVCPWILSGKILCIPDDGIPRELDYGNGNCDASATITVLENVYNITL